MSVASEITDTEQVVNETSSAKKINSLLNSPKTRTEGLELLKSYLPQCPDDDFIKYCVSWMQNCCKADGLIKNKDYGVKLLGTLFQISSNYQELKKSVSFFITTRYFDYILKYFLNSEIGWACTEICITCYRGACGPFQETLEKHLTNEVRKNGKVSPAVAKCFALLPSFGGGGNENLNYWRNWKTQFKKFLNVCHLILNNLFINLEELEEYESSDDSHWMVEENQKTPENLTNQLYNYCTILNHMLLCQYPAPKAIPTDLVFQLICRGLAINPKSFGKKTTTDIIVLQKTLPEIHIILLSLLKSLIVTCKNQLLPYAHLVCKLLRQSLEWTESEVNCRGEKPFGQVRISTYETLYCWLAATGSGGYVESISSALIPNAIGDITIKKDVVVLKESKQKVQHHSKEQGSRRVSPRVNETLCFAALKALQFLLKFVGVLLKPEEHKFLQEFTAKLLVDIQKTSISDIVVPFSVSKCRTELYSLLLNLVQYPCPKWPPPTHFALRLFRRGIADECLQVSLFCSSALGVTVNLIHPQYNNEGFSQNETRETQREWRSQPMEIDTQPDCSQSENFGNTSQMIDESDKISDFDRSDISLEDSVITVAFAEDAYQNEISEKLPEKSPEKTNEVPSPKKSPEKTNEKPSPKKSPEKTNEKPSPKKSPEKSNEEPSPKKSRMSPQVESLTPEPQEITIEEEETVTTEAESKKSDYSESLKNVTPEGVEIKPKKTYFLRSTTKGSSDEREESRSPENGRNTPLKSSIKGTPRRPRTRALSKVESESETESKATKKSEDDDEDIMAAFHDSAVE